MRQRVVHEYAGGKRAGACVEGPLRFNAGGVLAEVPMPERLALREKLRALRPGEPGEPGEPGSTATGRACSAGGSPRPPSAPRISDAKARLKAGC